jgi:PAS domain S-box-containing protein
LTDGQDTEHLRQSAEQSLSIQPELEMVGGGFADPNRVIHEMQVQQLELEIQNEGLHNALAEAQALQLKYRDLYELAPVGYLTLSEAGEIVELNQRAIAMLGQGKENLLSRPLLMWVAQHEQMRAERFMLTALQTPEDVRLDGLELSRKPGLPIYVNAQARSMVDPISGEKRIHIVLMDVTALRMAVDDVIRSMIQTGA